MVAEEEAMPPTLSQDLSWEAAPGALVQTEAAMAQRRGSQMALNFQIRVIMGKAEPVMKTKESRTITGWEGESIHLV